MAKGYEASVLFEENYNARAHVVINQGGSSSGKTTAIMQVLFTLACEQTQQVITVTGQDTPNLKSGVLRDALKIYKGSKTLMAAIKTYNKSERVFEFHTGSVIEFKSYADAQDAKSGKRDYLFVNEANGISWDVYSELALRTRKRVFIDYNPNADFWVHEHLMGKPGVQLIISDHRHNPFVDKDQRIKIESLKETDKERWKVYARGLTGKIDGLVLNNWRICEGIPARAKLIAAGLDFGYSNDPTGCIVVYKQNGQLWIEELIYETGLTNPDISGRLEAAGLNKNTEIIADSAEPKSIEELRRLGWRITPARKGPDSVRLSIDILKRYKLNITRTSINLLDELKNYKWKKARTGRILNQPSDDWNHLIDPLRYIALNKLKINILAKSKVKFPFVPQPAAHGLFEEIIGN
ncbi:MAG TPA: terminase large subunit [Mucilaginibacter sp.]|jgi:phage terminase large subunit|nr:terminase large subunit [Mucilaginibacter sp.]